jgi:hypothetical protein
MRSQIRNACVRMKNGTVVCWLLKRFEECEVKSSLETSKIAAVGNAAKFTSWCPATLVARNGNEFGKGWEGADKSQ